MTTDTAPLRAEMGWKASASDESVAAPDEDAVIEVEGSEDA